ncbi:MAG: hypothetical protein LVQ97_03650 [Candidatus Micrarchaeales archaeon]|jgi:Uncharacterized protein conserved in archaea, COG1460|uniref:DNA-directed RNA polymerase subunit Rpo4 n=1 Tax=Candidatus Micrarchaeum acidiphilum ARMAN-2 TaxID=425595 RepID=C7DGJ4_MICA2|nr:MAG: RNA polymerase Rpb4 [Candidatus Micrarchaeum acidiphilum ARMAN-2]MCW6161252.1 hypothetical protein [Candidatus Micrarchaeales archaeon]
MIGKKAEKENYVSTDEVYKILEERKKGKRPLTYEQQRALEHAEKFKEGSAAAQKLRKRLDEVGISEQTVVNIINIAPKNSKLLGHIIESESAQINDEKLKMIKEILGIKD